MMANFHIILSTFLYFQFFEMINSYYLSSQHYNSIFYWRHSTSNDKPLGPKRATTVYNQLSQTSLSDLRSTLGHSIWIIWFSCCHHLFCSKCHGLLYSILILHTFHMPLLFPALKRKKVLALRSITWDEKTQQRKQQTSTLTYSKEAGDCIKQEKIAWFTTARFLRAL